MSTFRQAFWQKELKTNSQWYLSLQEEIETLIFKAESAEEKKVKEEIYAFVSQQLEKDDVLLGESGEDWDEERSPIDTVVVHHTSREDRSSEGEISAIDLLRLYAPRYWAEEGRPVVRGQPIWSGHFYNNHQTFCPYHWLVYADGSVEQVLRDSYIGWHAGDWDINCRSVAIALDGDFSEVDPLVIIVEKVAEIITTHYSNVPSERVYGHREVYEKTDCPGNTFLGSGGWGARLLEYEKV